MKHKINNPILKKLEKKGKTSVSITIDNDLLDNLNQLKKEEEISSLSPIINLLLWEWYHDIIKDMEEQNKE